MNSFDTTRLVYRLDGIIFFLKKKCDIEYFVFVQLISFRQSRVQLPLLWFILFSNLFFGFGEADVSTIVNAASNPSTAPTSLGCHKRLYTYRITQSDSNGKIFKLLI